MDDCKFQTDWLGTKKVFYNERTSLIGYSIHDVIDYDNFDFHPEGLHNYLRFGFSFGGQTPIRDVKYLRHSAELVRKDGKLIINEFSDIVPVLLQRPPSKEEDVIELIRNKINLWVDSINGLIIIPTSGGFDSRLLNLLSREKNRIIAISYGISENSDNSREVVIANKLAQILNIRWRSIQLGYFNKYIKDWFQIYGPTVHLHGMYQMEFYSLIKQFIPEGGSVLSGIIGDAWAGSVNLPKIRSVEDVYRLGYNHGISADNKFCILPANKDLITDFFYKHFEFFKCPNYRVVSAMRTKIVLLRYLVEIPEYFGFGTYSPFLDSEVATAMLRLPAERKRNRQWQIDLFRKLGVNIEDFNLKFDTTSKLDIMANRLIPLEPLNIHILKEIFDVKYIEWINNNIDKEYNVSKYLIPIFKRIGIINKQQIAMNAYWTIKPLEFLLLKRNVLCKR